MFWLELYMMYADDDDGLETWTRKTEHRPAQTKWWKSVNQNQLSMPPILKKCDVEKWFVDINLRYIYTRLMHKKLKTYQS